MRSSSLVLGIVLIAGLVGPGCTDNGGGAGPTDGPPPAGVPLKNGGYAAIPPACAVATSQTVPHKVKFRFRNPGDRSVFFSVQCQIPFEVASCATNYADDVGPQGAPCNCSFQGNCPVGGPCQPVSPELAGGQTREAQWDAILPVTVLRPYECSEDRPLPAGRYRVRLPLYDTLAGAQTRAQPTITATADFDLPAPGDVVEVTF